MSEVGNDITTSITTSINDTSNNNTHIDVSNNQHSAIQEQKERMIQMKEARTEQLKRELVQVVCRQTELTTDEAREMLEKEQYNYMKVLNDYFEIKETKKEISSSVNQQIYGEIRNLMDTGAKSYRIEQERSEYIKKMNERRIEALKIANNAKIEKTETEKI
jgi:hypothetical protein|tara:strand:- start:1483 stop:1968 length:486 start_codon:yes stop_codon:yes gene_type:complete